MRRPPLLRWAVLVVAGGLGLASMLAALAAGGSEPIMSLIFASFAIVCLWVALALWRDRSAQVIFDGERLVDDLGTVLCTLDEIQEVERGLALWKPSNGFGVLLKARAEGAWAPGLWWRWGRRIGVGGATPGRAGKAMGDAIFAALAERNAHASRL